MNAWKSLLRKDSTDWLLEKDQPSARYFTLTDILNRSVENPDVKAAKKAIMTTGDVPKILAKQKNKGYWENLMTSTFDPNIMAQYGNS